MEILDKHLPWLIQNTRENGWIKRVTRGSRIPPAANTHPFLSKQIPRHLGHPRPTLQVTH
jgi:hypothetical protein